MVNFGSWQSPNEFSTGGIARYFEDWKREENAARGRKMPFMDGHYIYDLLLMRLFFLKNKFIAPKPLPYGRFNQ